MPQSDTYTDCLLCGKKLNHRACLHSDGIHIRSEIEDELRIVHQECLGLVLMAIKKRDWLYIGLLKD